jgi:hypothetical protein
VNLFTCFTKPSFSFSEFLLSGEEGMALVAQLDMHLAGLGAPGGERIPARAGDVRFGVIGMNLSLHRFS